MGYVTENELTPEEQAQVIRAIPEEYQNEDTFYLVYKKKHPSQGLLPQTGTTELAIAGLSIATASLAVLLLSKNIVKSNGTPINWFHGAKPTLIH